MIWNRCRGYFDPLTASGKCRRYFVFGPSQAYNCYPAYATDANGMLPGIDINPPGQAGFTTQAEAVAACERYEESGEWQKL